jgi:tripartite-type tricarboxylate transporter receptor subunit TctC
MNDPRPKRRWSALPASAWGAMLCVAGMLAVAPCAARKSQPAGYPDKSLRIIVANPPGAADDVFARLVGADLSAFYRRSVVIENRSGAGGLIGNALVSRATADGHTLAMIGVTRLITEIMHEPPPYRALADVVGVAHVASITNVLVTAPAIPARTAAEFVAYARPRVGELNFASLGIGSASHLAGEVFTRAVGIDAVHVPFTRLTDSFVEKSLGRVHYAVFTLPSVLVPVREGRLRALAVMTPQRSSTLPTVPAIAEAGLPEAQIDSWSGIVAPRGTPKRIVEQLHGDIVRALRKATLREVFASQGAESTSESTPDGFTRMMREEYSRYQSLIRDRRILAH